MHRVLVAALVAALLAMACAEESPTSSAGSGGDGAACDTSNPPVLHPGMLMVATDRPAYPPWFEGDPQSYSGFEGEVASEIAERLDLAIAWVGEPFNRSYAPGAKDYDFDINQISITPEREQAVDFSDGYFKNNQGLLTLKDNPLAQVTTMEELRSFTLGTQVGTTSLDFINTVIQPDEDPKIFDTTNDVKSALESGQIDGLVTDVVTTVYLRDFEIDNSVVVGQFPTNEPFGMLFEQGNPLRGCVNEVLAEMKSDGTLEALQEEWLQDYLSVPIVQE